MSRPDRASLPSRRSFLIPRHAPRLTHPEDSFGQSFPSSPNHGEDAAGLPPARLLTRPGNPPLLGTEAETGEPECAALSPVRTGRGEDGPRARSFLAVVSCQLSV